MNSTKRAGNPLGAAIAGLVIAGMGVFLLLAGQETTPRAFGGVLVVLGLLGAAANLALRRHYRSSGRRSGPDGAGPSGSRRG